MSSYSDQTYTTVLTRELGNASDGVQKSEGSLVYNALSAIAYEIERLYIQMDYIASQAHAETADYDHLKLIAADRGLTPYDATYAKVKVLSDAQLPVGTRFNLKSYNYAVTEQTTGDNYTSIAVCEESGTGPNGLTGECTMIDYVEGLTSCKITEVLVNGQDYETQSDFYTRYIESFTSASFAGNITAYKTQIKAINGVGGVKIYPVWNGGGTVKAVIQASDYGAPSAELIETIQETFNPTPSKGYGVCPIGHDFTAEAVTETSVNISTKIQFAEGYSYETLKENIEKTATAYFLELSEGWEDKTALTVYISRLEAELLNIEGIEDINSTSLNGAAANLTLGENSIPAAGTITVETIS